jgi:hypothetical protein
MLSII